MPSEEFAAEQCPNSAGTEGGASIYEHITLVRRTNFPPNETTGGRNDDYIRLPSESNQSVCGRPVTGSLCSRQIYGLHSLDCFESGTLLPNCDYQQTVVYVALDYCCSDQNWFIEIYIIRSSIEVTLIVWHCVVVFKLRDMASDDWADGKEASPSFASSGPLAGTFLGPALDIRSDSLYELTPVLQDVIGLRAIRPDAAVAKVMSVRNSRCIRVVTPDDHVTCGCQEILLHDLGDEDLPFVPISKLDVSFPYLQPGYRWSVDVCNDQYRASRIRGDGRDCQPEKEGWFGREGQPPGPSMIVTHRRVAPIELDGPQMPMAFQLWEDSLLLKKNYVIVRFQIAAIWWWRETRRWNLAVGVG